MRTCLAAGADSSANNCTNGKRVVGRPFRKGQSGNPSGRPHTRTVRLREEILDFLSGADPKERLKTRLQTMIARLYDYDPRTLLHYAFGKPVETHQLMQAENEQPTIDPKVIALARELARQRIEEQWDDEIRQKVERKYYGQANEVH